MCSRLPSGDVPVPGTLPPAARWPGEDRDDPGCGCGPGSARIGCPIRPGSGEPDSARGPLRTGVVVGHVRPGLWGPCQPCPTWRRFCHNFKWILHPPNLKPTKNGPKPPKCGPETHLDRGGSPCTTGCTQNQPRRRIMMLFLGQNEFKFIFASQSVSTCA